MTKVVLIIVGILAAAGFIILTSNSMQKEPTVQASEKPMTPVEVPKGQAVATFGTGCFWCMEAAFQESPGVIDAISGYAGGDKANPTYEDVYTQSTTHRESVQVFYDPNKLTYNQLLDIFWQGIDPTDDGGQFVDRGFSYTTAIFYHNDEQRQLAEQSKQALESTGRFDKPVVTPIIEFTNFYRAEEYHQDFYKKSKDRYKQYSENSGRVEFKQQIWEEIKKQEQHERNN